MAYSHFKLSDVIEQFQLAYQDDVDLFGKVPEVAFSEHLSFSLHENLPLAVDINTEKARSEMIIAPLLFEVRRQLQYQISLFSGKEFNVDAEKGLMGVCDFIISLSKSQILIRTPVIAIVEAKNEDIIGGLGQCAAAMVAAQLFNQRAGNPVKVIYGIVTTGTVWRFLTLQDQSLAVDALEYYIRDGQKILGILLWMISMVSQVHE